jgi:hypothetical protein
MTNAAAVAGALADRCEQVAIALLGPLSGTSGRELRFGRRGSFALRRDGAKRGKWFDHERGEGGDMLHLLAREHGVRLGEAIRIAERDYLGSAVVPLPRPAPPSDVQPDNTQHALRMWQQTTSLVGTLGERYFVEHRRLDIRGLEFDHVLRWHAQGKCVIALMTSPLENRPTGIHRTFLNEDGTKCERKMLGRKGCIRLSFDHEVTLGLGLVEGVEDGIAVLLSGWRPIWAAADAGALAKFPVLHGIECLTVFADADTAGMQAARQCADRWTVADKEARISPPARSRHA